MAGVYPLEKRDIPAVAELFARVYPHARWVSHSECVAYFKQIFFGNPWLDPKLPSWVAREGSRAVGFIGVVPRPMRLRKALAGPQALTISDGANESSRKMWEALGGLTSTLYSLQWRRLLRPAQSAPQRASSPHGRAAARGVALSPQYEPASLDWLLGQARAKRRHGELQARVLREPGSAIAGWFL